MWDTTNFDVRGQWPAESRRLAADIPHPRSEMELLAWVVVNLPNCSVL